MILADENIDHQLIDSIRKAGIEVYSVYEQNRGISDEEVIDLSRNPSRLILTEDKDFGEWVFAHHIEGISVILLRYHFKETEQISKILIDLLQKHGQELHGRFTTITIDKVRTRSI
jgi:predicted nuclease of predicted toxin-antitoxin system